MLSFIQVGQEKTPEVVLFVLDIEDIPNCAESVGIQLGIIVVVVFWAS